MTAEVESITEDGYITDHDRYYGFVTTVGDIVYVNLVKSPESNDFAKESLATLLPKVTGYRIIKCKRQGNSLAVWNEDDTDFVENAIKAKRIVGVTRSSESGVRLTALSDELLRFFVAHDKDIFPDKDKLVYKKVE